MKSNLPEGWILTTIGAISQKASSVAPASVFESSFQYVDIASIDSSIHKVVDAKDYAVQDAPSRARQLIQTADTLISTVRPYLRKIAFITEEYNGQIASTGFTVVRPKQHIDPKYLFYYSISDGFIHSLCEKQRGASYPAVRDSDVFKEQIPLAPLAEQRRIVDQLDAAMQKLEASQERLEKLPELLKKFRQAVLAAAVSGKLTERWREQNTHPGSNWRQVTLEALLDGKPRNGYSPKSVEYETPVKSLMLSATTTGSFRAEYFKYIDEIIPESSHLWLEPNDVLVQRANSLDFVGVSAIYEGPRLTFIYPDLMMKCRANKKVVPKFLHYLLLSEPVRRYFRENATGTAGNMPKINQQTLLNTPVSIPEIEEQQEVIRQVNSYFELADQIEARFEQAAALVEQMPQALLAKAFNGQLVPQDANDEPASVLLERLQAQITVNTSTLKPRRKSRAKQEEVHPLLFDDTTSQLSVKPKIDTSLSSAARQLVDLIRKSPNGITPERLFAMMDFSEDNVEDFYRALVEIKDMILEQRPQGNNELQWSNGSNIYLHIKFLHNEA